MDAGRPSDLHHADHGGIRMNNEDDIKIRLLRQQYETNESLFRTGQISEKEYQETLNFVGMKIVMLEEKYGLYEEL